MKFVVYLSPLLWMACASVKPPTGGPKDETPPQLIAYTVDTNQNLWKHQMLFDEKIELGRLSDLYINPLTEISKIKEKPKQVFFETPAIRDNYTIVAKNLVRDITEKNTNDSLQIHVMQKSQDSLNLFIQVFDPIYNLPTPIDSIKFSLRNVTFRTPSKDSFFQFTMLPAGPLSIQDSLQLPSHTYFIFDRDTLLKLYKYQILDTFIRPRVKHPNIHSAYILKGQNTLPETLHDEEMGFAKVKDTLLFFPIAPPTIRSQFATIQRDSLSNSIAVSRLLSQQKNNSLQFFHVPLQKPLRDYIVSDSQYSANLKYLIFSSDSLQSTIQNIGPNPIKIKLDTLSGQDSILYIGKTYVVPPIDSSLSSVRLKLPKKLNYPLCLFFVQNNKISQHFFIHQYSEEQVVKIKNGIYTLTIVEDQDNNQKLSVYKKKNHLHVETFYHYQEPLTIPEKWTVTLEIPFERLNVNK